MLCTMISLCPGLQSFGLVSLQGVLSFMTARLAERTRDGHRGNRGKVLLTVVIHKWACVLYSKLGVTVIFQRRNSFIGLTFRRDSS